MTDQRSPVLAVSSSPDANWLRGPAAQKPVDPAGFLETIGASFRTAQADQAGDDEQAVIDAYGPLVTELHRRGKPVTRYVQASRGTGRPVNEDAVWRDITAARALDPKAFDGVPADRSAFRRDTLAKYRARIAADADTASRGGLLPNLIGGLGAGFTDPINVGTMMVGGGGTTLAVRIATEALANAGVEAAQQPLVALQRARTGRDLTAEEAVRNVALAGALGGAIGGVAHVVGARLKAGRSPAGDLADQMRETIGAERMTPEERAATAALDRENDILATSPYQPGAGSATHLDRMDAATDALRQPAAPSRPRAETPRPRLEPIATFSPDDYKPQLARVESGGDWNVQAKTSSAYGRYQFTRATWLHYARQFPAYRGESDEALWALRTNRNFQENVADRLIRDQRAVLARGGVPETHGTMYLLHFAGEGAGMRILKAADDAPIEGLVSAKAIEANPFLRGKTAGWVREWAHRTIGERGREGPVLSREGFADDAAGDAEWRAAQQEADLAAAELDRVRGEEAGAPPRLDDEMPFDLDDPRSRSFEGAERDPFADLPAGVRLDDDGHVPSIDAADRPLYHGTRGVWADDNPNGLGMTFFGESRAVAERYAEGGGGRRTAGGEPTVIERTVPPEARILDLTTREGHEVLAALDRVGGRADDWIAAAQRGMAEMDGPGGDASALWRLSTNVWQLTKSAAGGTAASVRRIAEQLAEHGYAGMRFMDDQHPTVAMFDHPASRAAERDAPGGTAPARDGAAGDDVPTATATATGFDHPDDVAAARQIDSLEHDLRMFLEEDDAKGMTVRLNEEGDVVSAADAMADLDADDAAIAAARACMTPGGAA